MSDIWLAAAIGFCALAAIVYFTVDLLLTSAVSDELKALADENDKLRLQNDEILKRIEATNANVLSVERKINK